MTEMPLRVLLSVILLVRRPVPAPIDSSSVHPPVLPRRHLLPHPFEELSPLYCIVSVVLAVCMYKKQEVVRAVSSTNGLEGDGTTNPMGRELVESATLPRCTVDTLALE